MSASRLPDGCLGRCALSETFRSKLEEIQTQAPPLRSRVCPAMENARSINANYIRGGVKEFGNPLPSILKRAAYQGTRVRQLGMNAKDCVAYLIQRKNLTRVNSTLEVSLKPKEF
jgi:hypothetical protein